MKAILVAGLLGASALAGIVHAQTTPVPAPAARTGTPQIGSYGFDTTLVRTVREAATDWCWSYHLSSDFIFHFPLRPSAFAIAQNALDRVDESESTADDTVRIRTCGIQSR